MRFLVAAFGTRGDVQPVVAAARALVAKGHRCDCFVPPNLVDWVRGFGLTATGVGLDYAAVSKSASEGRFVDLLRVLPKVGQQVELQLDAMTETAARSDVILGCSVFAAGQLLAEQFRIPYRFLALSPFLIPSRDHPAPFVRRQTLPGWLNGLSWALNSALWGWFLDGPLARRRRQLGLPPPAPTWSTLLGASVLLACEPAVFPAGAPLEGARRTVQQIGALFLEGQGALSPQVEAFLAAGPPPVYVGFGSMSDPRPQRTVSALVEGARRAKVRLLLSRGWAGFELPALADDVLLIDAEPHLELFPRCAAVVHHGGIGTTHAAMRAGVPQLVVPQMLDQFYTAHRLRLAGLGSSLGDRHGLRAARFARALEEVLDPRVRERARLVASRLTLDGVDRLVEALTRAA